MRQPLPTEAELDILRVLWTLGPATVREVHSALADRSSTGYTTVLKQMQIMLAKGLLKRDDAERSHVYRAAAAAEKTQGKMVSELMERAFSGSASQLVMRALSVKPTSAKELAEIRSLLDSMGSTGKGN
jgi:BlaI family penicillinase repressor